MPYSNTFIQVLVKIIEDLKERQRVAVQETEPVAKEVPLYVLLHDRLSQDLLANWRSKDEDT